MTRPQLRDAFRAAAGQLRPVRVHRHAAALSGTGAKGGRDIDPAAIAGVAARDYRPAVVGEGDSFCPQFGAKGVPPGVRPVHLASIVVTVATSLNTSPRPPG